MYKSVEGYNWEDFMSVFGMIVHVFQENSYVLHTRRPGGRTKVKEILRATA